jgi:hypothetical protein
MLWWTFLAKAAFEEAGRKMRPENSLKNTWGRTGANWDNFKVNNLK